MSDKVAFDDDVTRCAELVQQGDPDRFLATMAAPVAARPVLFALYAFNIELARAPWASQESMISEMRVQWWRDIGSEIAQGGPVRRHFVATPLGRLLPHHLAAHIEEMAEARRWDIYREPFEDEGEFDRYIDATTGGLMWMAAASLGPADEATVRRFAYGVGVSNWLLAIPELVQHKRIPLLDGTPDGLRRLAQKALDQIEQAQLDRDKISREAGSALLSGWQARGLLRQVLKAPERVAEGSLGQSEFRRRAGLIWRSSRQRW